MTASLFTLLTMSAMLPGQAPVTIEVAKAMPVQGEMTAVSASALELNAAAKVRLEATYAPNAQVAKRVIIGSFTATQSTVAWAPERAGIVTLELYHEGAQSGSAPIAKKTLSVAFDGTPLSGVLMMLAAGCILFGGAFVTLRQIMRA